MRPNEPPEFSTDAPRLSWSRLIHDLQLEVPAPENQEKGGFVGAPAKIYRVKIPLAEISLSYKVDTSKPGSMRIQAKVEEFNPGTDSQVLAIADDEAKRTRRSHGFRPPSSWARSAVNSASNRLILRSKM